MKMAAFWLIVFALMTEAANTSEMSKLLPYYMAQQPRRQPSSCFLL
jgi:hypothetical protein